MPEILFRGKRKEHDFFGLGGEWVYGIPIKTHIGIFICFEENPHYCNQYGYMEIEEISKVIPETVGAFTGLTDKNGVKIFEGDIVTLPEETEPYEMRYVIQWEEDNARFIATAEGDTYSFDNIWGCQVEVIGNIHDNPELLEGSDRN